MNKEISKEEALSAIADALIDVEDAISHHPKRIKTLYRKGKATFMDGQKYLEHTAWSRSTGLTLEQLALIH